MRRRSSRSVSAAEKNGPNSIVKRADGIGVAGVAIAEARGAGADGIGAMGGGANAGGAVGGGAKAGAVRDGGVIAGGMIDVDGGAAGGAVGGTLGGGVGTRATGARVTGVDAPRRLGGGPGGRRPLPRRGPRRRRAPRGPPG